MSSFWKRAAVVTSITAMSALGLTACGDDAPTPAASSSSAAAGDSDGASTASGELDVLTKENFAERVGAAQAGVATVHTAVTVSSNGQDTQMSGDLALDEDPAKVAMAMTIQNPAGGDMELRVVDGTLYLNMGEQSMNKFVATSLDGAGAESFATLLEQSNPQRQTETLTAALEKLTADEDTTTIDGVETRGYTLTLNTAKALEGQQVPTDGTELPDTVEYVMYIAADDLPRRMVVALNDVTTESTFSKWGESVTIEAPGPDETIDPASLGG